MGPCISTNMYDAAVEPVKRQKPAHDDPIKVDARRHQTATEVLAALLPGVNCDRARDIALAFAECAPAADFRALLCGVLYHSRKGLTLGNRVLIPADDAIGRRLPLPKKFPDVGLPVNLTSKGLALIQENLRAFSVARRGGFEAIPLYSRCHR